MNRTYVPYEDREKHVHFKGDWSAGLTVEYGDEYANDGALFVCILGHVSSALNEPIPEADEVIIGPTGATGATGATGLQGPKGDPGGDANNWAYNESPTGDKNGSNQEYELAHTPTGEVMLVYQGMILKPGVGNDYTISGTTITLLNYTPYANDNLLAFYPY